MDNKIIKDLLYQVAAYEDETAYHQLFNEVFPSLQCFANSFVKNRQIAEEISSDILLEVWEKRTYYTKIENPVMYLLTATKNLSLKKIKIAKTQNHLPLEQVKTEFLIDYAASENPNIPDFINTINETVSKLPEKCKMIFKLAKEEKLRYKEIASLLNISVKTIDAQISIAVKKISLELMKQKNKFLINNNE